MNVDLLTKHHLGFLSLYGGCTGSSESTLVKMPHWWKSHVTAHICVVYVLVSIPHGAMGLSVICHSGISCLYSLVV